MGDPAYALDGAAALFFFLTFSHAGSHYRSWVTGQSIGGEGRESYIWEKNEKIFLSLSSDFQTAITFETKVLDSGAGNGGLQCWSPSPPNQFSEPKNHSKT